MRSIRWQHAVLVALMAAVATACGDDGDGQGKPCTSDFRVGVAYDVSGLGDKSFNDAAHAGLQRAIDDGLVDAACVTTNQATRRARAR